MGKNQSSINQSNEKKIIINDLNYINDIYIIIKKLVLKIQDDLSI